MNDVPIELREAIYAIDPMMPDWQFEGALLVVGRRMARHGFTWEQAIEDIKLELERIRGTR